MTHQRIAAIIAVLFFFVWLVILYAGADHPPPKGFAWVVLLDLVAALLVFWRVPYYLDWMQTGLTHRLLLVVRDGLVAGAAFALLAMLVVPVLGAGEPGVSPTIRDRAIWFAVLAAVGIANALAIYRASVLLAKV
jgi:membrane protease YdiL (CAAX protease family)